jgi:hypothetical protein
VDPVLSEILRKFEKTCVERATGGNATYEDYERERANVLGQPQLLPHLPSWVSRCRTGGQFWDLMKKTSAHWADRRTFIHDSLNTVHDWIERGGSGVHGSVDAMLKQVSSETIASAWQKILARRSTDPAGTITSARSLVESTCKHILDELGVEYDNEGELPKLYKLTAKHLKLGVDQHDEQIFKQILTACGSAVEGLAGLRNRHGDAHGLGKKALRPAPRHADLAANLAGTMCTFLIATFEARKSEQGPNKSPKPTG